MSAMTENVANVGTVNGAASTKQKCIEETKFMSTTTSSSNGHVTATVTTNGTTKATAQNLEQLKILDHLKNIELINEKRRYFLNNTLSECTEQKTTETITNTSNGHATVESNGVLHKLSTNEKCTVTREENNAKSAATDATETILKAKPTTPLYSPKSPPPKPPMLSRTRSIGVGDHRVSLTSTSTTPSQTPTPTPTETPATPAMTANNNGTSTIPPIVTTTITTTTIPKFNSLPVQTIQLESDNDQEATVVLRNPPDNVSQSTITTLTETSTAEKSISSKHYEHLIEELKCPGCAHPMKAPILLCETGHSICEQCTRILMMCPLCKEPFTKMRSLTVEALCSKAHFRCINAAGGCTVRLQKDLLSWHEKQCIYKPMKCFMGRVWGDCQWDGREIQWKEHLEADHASKLFKTESMDLIWNMGVKQKPLTGYYVFMAYSEMFNFYAIHDKERILFTMTCTSSVKEKKHHFAYEVTLVHPCNEALAITQKFPVHSEYDSDILMEGTCISITLSDLAKFMDDERLLHYRVRVLQVNSPRKSKSRLSLPIGTVPKNFQNTQIAGVNLKNVPSNIIVTRKEDIPLIDDISPTPTTNGNLTPASEDEVEKMRRLYHSQKKEDGDSESDPEFEAFIAKRWGTPQLHFNRKYLKNISSDNSANGDPTSSQYKNYDTLGQLNQKHFNDDRVSVASTNVSYKKKMSNTLRKSFRTLKTEINGMKPFGKKSPERITAN